MEIVAPSIGECFTYRCFPRWQFWRRGFGAAQMLSIEPEGGIVHLRIIGAGAEIRHIPILASYVLPYVHKSGGLRTLPDGFIVQIQAWRSSRAAGAAGAFALPLHAAVVLIEQTVERDQAETSRYLFVESAYPVRSSDGSFSTVKAVVAKVDQQIDGA